MKITIHLPVSLPMKKFLISKFGEEYHPGQQDWLGILLSALLDRKSQSNWESRIGTVDYPERYKINFNLSYSQKHGIILSPVHEALLRKSIETFFRDHLYEQALINKECYGIDYKTTFENALDFYGIQEENKSYLQTLMRDFNRKKKKNDKQ